MKSESKHLQWLYWAVVAAHIGMVLRLPVFPSQDGPVHLYYAKVFASLVGDPTSFGGEFRIGQYLPPYSALNYLFVVLGRFLDPVGAEKAVVAIYIALFAAGFLYFARALNDGFPAAVFLIFPFVLHRLVYMGFYNFCLGTGLALLLMGFWLRNHEHLRGWRSGVYVLLVFALLVTHPVPMLVVILFLGVHLLVQLWGTRAVRPLGRQLAHAAVAAAAALYVPLFFFGRMSAPQRPPLRLQVRRLLDLVPFRPFQDNEHWWILVLFLAVGAVLALRAVIRLMTAERDSKVLAVLCLGLLTVCVYLVAPHEMNGASYFDERFPIFAVGCLVAVACTLRLPSRTATALAVALVLGGIGALVLQTRETDRAASIHRVLLEAPIPAAETRGAIVVDGGRELTHTPYSSFGPCYWAPTRYFQRAGAVLLNAPWLDLPFTLLRPGSGPEHVRVDADGMALYLQQVAATGGTVPGGVDFLIRVDCLAPFATDSLSPTEQFARRLGMERMPWSTEEYTFYARPGLF